MRQRLEIINKTENSTLVGNTIEHTTTFIARSVNGNGIDLNLQIIVHHSNEKQHLLKDLAENFSSKGTLDIGSIIQVDFKQRFQKESH
jgi:hypothetical protein